MSSLDTMIEEIVNIHPIVYIIFVAAMIWVNWYTKGE